MSLRIRYEEKTEGFYQSIKKFQHPTNGARYKIFLNLTDNEWQVVDDVTDIVSASGRDINLARMKKAAKEALTLLGVEFKSEAGQRKPYQKRTQNVA